MKIPQLSLAAALACTFVFAISADAQEWTRFRGENGSGVGKAKGMPANITIADYKWIVELSGSGHSSPITETVPGK